MAGFIAAQRVEHQIPHATACRALGVSPAWFYKWRYGDASPRHARRRALAAEVARLFAAHRGRYGSPRITDDLREAGWRVSKNTVAMLMVCCLAACASNTGSPVSQVAASSVRPGVSGRALRPPTPLTPLGRHPLRRAARATSRVRRRR